MKDSIEISTALKSHLSVPCLSQPLFFIINVHDQLTIMTDADVLSICRLYRPLCLSASSNLAFTDEEKAVRELERQQLKRELSAFGVVVTTRRRTWRGRSAWASRCASVFWLAWRSGSSKAKDLECALQAVVDTAQPASAGQGGEGGEGAPPRFVLSAAQQDAIMGVLLFSHGVMEERLPFKHRPPCTKFGDALLTAFRLILALLLATTLVNHLFNPFFR